jgi:hypothetical protein
MTAWKTGWKARFRPGPDKKGVDMNTDTYAIHLKTYKTISIVFTVLVALLAIILAPKSVPFAEFTSTEIANLLIKLAIAALFIERSIEVIMVAWRGRGKQKYISNLLAERKKGSAKQADSRILSEEEIEAARELEEYSAETKVLALLTAFGLGIVISALGLRALEPLLDADFFGSLGRTQKALFMGMDTLITGALLGGGSEGIHKILDSILSMFEKYRTKV